MKIEPAENEYIVFYSHLPKLKKLIYQSQFIFSTSKNLKDIKEYLKKYDFDICIALILKKQKKIFRIS